MKWENLDLNHPWLNVLKKENQATVENLIRLAIAVYNDSKLFTPSAWSWPSQSLASLCAKKQITLFNENGSDTSFSEYEPLPIDLHYRDPMVYAEMLNIIADLEIAKLKGTSHYFCYIVHLGAHQNLF